MAQEPQDRWIAVGLEHQVRHGSSGPAMIDGQPIAVWRGDDGPPNVWEDRCPHRGMRLSFGFVRGNMLRCIYHGWGYGPGGQCASIPAHPELTPPKTICANVYASETRYGILWANLADRPAAALPDLGPEDGWLPVRSLYVNRPADSVNDDLADADHGIPGATVRNGVEGVARIEAGGDLTLLVAIQPVDRSRTGLHVIARGKGASDADQRLNLARKMQRLRGALEAR